MKHQQLQYEESRTQDPGDSFIDTAEAEDEMVRQAVRFFYPSANTMTQHGMKSILCIALSCFPISKVLTKKGPAKGS
jgi:hypothetical protein